ADEHRLAAVCEIDAGDAGAALRQHFDETFRRKPAERLRHRKARYAEPRAERRLVHERAGRQVEPHDRVADQILHARDRAAAPRGCEGGEKSVWTLAWLPGHCNMLVAATPSAQAGDASIREDF